MDISEGQLNVKFRTRSSHIVLYREHLCWVWVAGEGDTAMDPSEKLLESSPGSKSDPPLAKAKPISDGGCAFAIRYLRREI